MDNKSLSPTVKQDEWRDPDFAGAAREKVYDLLTALNWAGRTRMDRGNGMPEGWTVCQVGPNDAYVELPHDAVAALAEASDEYKAFWIMAAAQMAPEYVIKLLRFPDSYVQQLVRGGLLKWGSTEQGQLAWVPGNLKKVSRKVRNVLYLQGMRVNQQWPTALETMAAVVAMLDADFMDIKVKVQAYYNRAMAHNLLKLLGPWEEINAVRTVKLKQGGELVDVPIVNLIPDPRGVSRVEDRVTALKILSMAEGRQREICLEIMNGLNQKEIAKALGVSERTVRNELQRIRTKVLGKE